MRAFILLTGLRSLDARTVRWEHVNLGDEAVARRLPIGKKEMSVEIPPGCIHRPKPKGGEDRAFTVPLSTHVLELLARRQADNRFHFGDDHGWVFPTRDKKGCVTFVVEPKEQRTVRDEDGRKRVVYLPSPHRLRDTFATACLEAGVGSMERKILMNHTLSEGDVTEGYIRPSVEYLRECLEKLTAFVLKKAGAAEDEARRESA